MIDFISHFPNNNIFAIKLSEFIFRNAAILHVMLIDGLKLYSDQITCLKNRIKIPVNFDFFNRRTLLSLG